MPSASDISVRYRNILFQFGTGLTGCWTLRHSGIPAFIKSVHCTDGGGLEYTLQVHIRLLVCLTYFVMLKIHM
jgi:hypothetical protein